VLHAPRKIAVTVVALVMLVGAAALGRHIISGARAASSASTAASKAAPNTVSNAAGTPSGAHAGNGVIRSSSGAPTKQTLGGTAQAPATSETLPPVPVYAITPQIVRTATIDLRVGKDTLSSALTDIATMAGTEGGFVESSSMQGGTAHQAPLSGTIVFHVLNADFGQAMAALSGYGKVANQAIQGKDVTNQVSTNAASIQILQDQVNLLQGKLAQATDIDTFLQIQNQLFPVEERLQQLQNQQSVLTNSAALATITANLSTPDAALVSSPPARTGANAATVGWRYLRHNSLAVLDGLAVGGGWALPVVVLLALVWLAGTRSIRLDGERRIARVNHREVHHREPPVTESRRSQRDDDYRDVVATTLHPCRAVATTRDPAALPVTGPLASGAKT